MTVKLGKSGLLSSQDKHKIDTYPELNGDSDTFLNGSGDFVTLETGAVSVLGDDVVIGKRLTVGEKATLGERASIGEYATIGGGALIGDLSRLGDCVSFGKNAHFDDRAVIGDGVVLMKDASVGGDLKIGVFSSDGAKVSIRGGIVLSRAGVPNTDCGVLKVGDVSIRCDGTIEGGTIKGSSIVGSRLDNVTLTGSAQIANVTISGNEYVGGNESVNGKLSVHGAAVFDNGATIRAARLIDDAVVQRNLNIDNNIKVGNDAEIEGRMTCRYGATIYGGRTGIYLRADEEDATIDGRTIFPKSAGYPTTIESAKATLEAGSSIIGARLDNVTIVNSDIEGGGAAAGLGDDAVIGKRLTVGEKATLGERASIGEYATISEHVSIGNNATIGNHAWLGDDCDVGDRFIFGDKSTANGDFLMNGHATITDDLIIGPFGGDLTVKGTASLGSDVTIVGSEYVGGNATVNGTARIINDATIGGSEYVGGNASVKGKASIDGTAWISGNASVKGTASLDGGVIINNGATIHGDSKGIWLHAIPAHPITIDGYTIFPKSVNRPTTIESAVVTIESGSVIKVPVNQAVKADSLSSARRISIGGAVTGSTTFDGSNDVTISTTANNISATSASKLSASRKLTANLGVTTAGSFDGSNDVTLGAIGTLPVSKGGTGQTNLSNVAVGSATKATQDGSGNVITSTYAKLSGGTFTGAVTFNGAVTAKGGLILPTTSSTTNGAIWIS